MANKKEEPKVKPRRKIGKKSRSGLAIAGSAAAGAVVASAAALALQYYRDGDNRYYSGGMTALGLALAGAGAALDIPTLRDAGLGAALGAGAIFGSDAQIGRAHV